MTHSLTIHSPYNDLSELVEGLSPFYTGEHLVLRAPADVPEGEWIRFEVLLTDGTPGLTGLGRHAGTNDNGEDFGAERFDVYLGELQVDEGRSDVIWERIVLAFQQAQGGDRPTGEVDISQMEAELATRTAPDPVSDDSATDFESDAATAAGPISAFPEASGAAAGSDDDFAESFDEPSAELTAPPAAAPAPPRAAARPPAAPPAAPPAPPARTGGVLSRPSLPASWAPTAMPPSGHESQGLFAYGDSGLPVPARPPRPDGEERRIDPAPRPAAQ